MTNICLRAGHRQSLRQLIPRHASPHRQFMRPSFAPKPVLDLRHIRQNPGLYAQNCVDRNYASLEPLSWRILELHEQITERQKGVLQWRKRSNDIGAQLGKRAKEGSGQEALEALMTEAKDLKGKLAAFEDQEKELLDEIDHLALQLPNLSSMHTPIGDTPELIEELNPHFAQPGREGKSHADIGRELDILDFESAATTSGWGWYFLKNEGALLEQALIQYTLSVALARGWQIQTPPSLVYSHIASACGFNPRDQHGETQIYDITPHDPNPTSETPRLVLAGTAEIPFAGSQANKTLNAQDLPLKIIGPSRSYRAEAGARGVKTKGLYRVHEFTKVEMFAWTTPDVDGGDSDRFGDGTSRISPAELVFNEMLAIQKEIITSLGLHAQVLEMPTADLGASASRKIDIEAFFPSRTTINKGFGEVTSVSICTDYQTRRLGTRIRDPANRKPVPPYTVNGTALAVPRVLACIIENHWDEAKRCMRVPEVLRPYMPGGISIIRRKGSGSS